MFERKKVEVFVQSCRLTKEEDNVGIELELYITPIDYNLACEVDDELAEAMFHKLRNGSFKPRLNMPRASFILPEIPLQNMDIFPLNDKTQDKLGAAVPNVLISNVHARRLFPEDEGMSLIFRASLPYDSHSLALAARYFKKTMFVTFTDMQPNLPLETQGTTPLCEAEGCNLPAKVIDSKMATYCRKHVRAAEGEVSDIGKPKRESLKDASERIEKEKKSGKDAAAGKDD